MSSNNDYSQLLDIQDNNSPSIITLLPDEHPYFIDLDRREIETIKDIVVETDHKSSIIYFKVNRYFDNMDLAKTVCIIQYENSKKEQHVYVVPFYDVDTYSSGDLENPESMILFPWIISENLTRKDGRITFSIRFYMVNELTKTFSYSLSTLPSSFEIQKDIGFNPSQFQKEDENMYSTENWMEFLQMAAQQAKEGTLSWILLD